MDGISHCFFLSSDPQHLTLALVELHHPCILPFLQGIQVDLKSETVLTVPIILVQQAVIGEESGLLCYNSRQVVDIYQDIYQEKKWLYDCPRGTPDATGNISDFSPFSITCCVRPCRKLVIHCRGFLVFHDISTF